MVYYNPHQVIVSFDIGYTTVFIGMIFLGYRIVDIIPELNAGLMEVYDFPSGIKDIFIFIEYLLA